MFTASEKIPFHLRLDTSPAFLRSLAKLFLPQQDPSAIQELVHVYLMRQTTVNVQGTSFSHEDVLGRGQMMLQPSSASKVLLSESEEAVSWSWNGDLRCEVPVLNTGFSISQVTTTVSSRFVFNSQEPNLGYDFRTTLFCLYYFHLVQGPTLPFDVLYLYDSLQNDGSIVHKHFLASQCVNHPQPSPAIFLLFLIQYYYLPDKL